MTQTVNSAAALNSAIAASAPGDSVLLDPGVYEGVEINDVAFQHPILIAPARPPAAGPAQIVGLKVSGSSGIRFRGLTLASVGAPGATPVDPDAGTPYYSCRITNSERLAFVTCRIVGDSSKAASDPSQISGFNIENCGPIEFARCDLSYLFAAINALRGTGLSVGSCAFHNLNKGGVEVGQYVGLAVLQNNFCDFETAPEVHGDCVQVFTTGTTTSSRNIKVSGNVYHKGAATDDGAQGIFLQDEQGTLPLWNVEAEDNLLLGPIWDSLRVTNVRGFCRLNSNVMASWEGPNAEVGGETNFLATLQVGTTTGAVVSIGGNSAQAYGGGPTGSTYMAQPYAGTPPNVLLGPVSDNGAALFGSWLQTAAGLSARPFFSSQMKAVLAGLGLPAS